MHDDADRGHGLEPNGATPERSAQAGPGDSHRLKRRAVESSFLALATHAHIGVYQALSIRHELGASTVELLRGIVRGLAQNPK